MKPEKIIIVPVAHNYVSVDTDGNRLGGNSWISPHITAIKTTLHVCLDQNKSTTIIADKAYSWPKVLQWLSDILPTERTTIQTYDTFGWLDKNNKRESFDTKIARPQGDVDQLVLVVVSCSNELVREFLSRKTDISPEIIENIQDDNYKPQIWRLYVINNKDWSIQYL